MFVENPEALRQRKVPEAEGLRQYTGPALKGARESDTWSISLKKKQWSIPNTNRIGTRERKDMDKEHITTLDTNGKGVWLNYAKAIHK